MASYIHVDNSEFFRKQVRAFLEKEGFEVESFGSANEAELVIGSGIADMVIMGLIFVGMSGEEFLRRVVEYYSGPVIVISSSVDKDKEEKLKEEIIDIDIVETETFTLLAL